MDNDEAVKRFIKTKKFKKYIEALEGISFGVLCRSGESFAIFPSFKFKLEEDVSRFVKDNTGEFCNIDTIMYHYFQSISPDVPCDYWNCVGYDDEHTFCSSCGGIIRLTPACYGDTGNYHQYECSIVCSGCVEKNAEEYLEDIVNNAGKANTILTAETLAKYGYVSLPDLYETGFHHGQDDDPASAMEEARKKYGSVIISVVGVGQFDVSWQIYVKEER